MPEFTISIINGAFVVGPLRPVLDVEMHPIGEDKLNELGSEGFRMVFIVKLSDTSWISYMERAASEVGLDVEQQRDREAQGSSTVKQFTDGHFGNTDTDDSPNSPYVDDIPF